MKIPTQTTSEVGNEFEVGNRALISEVIARWRSGENPDAYQFLARHPGVSARHSLAMELAYEEYCLRRDGGERLSVATYCRRFPAIHKSLTRQIEIHEYLERHDQIADRFAKVTWPQVGETIFRKFEVLEELGSGGLAKVYLCRQLGVGGRQVVVKMAASGCYEADTLGRLSHPYIIPVLDVITTEDKVTGRPISGLYMPFRGRSTLCDLIDEAWGGGLRPATGTVLLDAAQRRTDPRDCYDQQTPSRSILRPSFVDTILQLGLALGDALQHTHAQGVLHGDLKPSNVLLTYQGQPQLFDFNLSFDETAQKGMTGGTLPYMSPEQVRSVVQQLPHEPPLDERADLFSLGAVLYELLTGELPFGTLADIDADDADLNELVRRQREGATPIHRRNPDVPVEISACIMACLAFDRRDRPPNVDAWQDHLRRLLRPTRRAGMWLTRNRGGVAALTLGVALIGLGHLLTEAPSAPRALPAETWQSGQFMRNYGRGRDHMGAREWAAARACFLAAYRETPEPQLEALIGYCEHRQRKNKPALEFYLRANSNGFASTGLYNNLGYWYLSRGEYDEAYSWFNRALTLRPDAVVPRFNRVVTEIRRGECNLTYYPATALSDVDKLVKDCEPNGYLYFSASRLYAMAARVDEKWVEHSINLLLLSWEHGMNLTGVQQDIAFSRVMQDPRFAEILQRAPEKERCLKFPRYLDPEFGIENSPQAAPNLAGSFGTSRRS